jgi:hypothetical protein
MYDHEDQRITRYCHVFCVIDIVTLSPQFHNKYQRSHPPINYERSIYLCYNNLNNYNLNKNILLETCHYIISHEILIIFTFRITIQQLGIPDTDGIIAI